MNCRPQYNLTVIVARRDADGDHELPREPCAGGVGLGARLFDHDDPAFEASDVMGAASHQAFAPFRTPRDSESPGMLFQPPDEPMRREVSFWATRAFWSGRRARRVVCLARRSERSRDRLPDPVHHAPELFQADPPASQPIGSLSRVMHADDRRRIDSSSRTTGDIVTRVV
jgi:hypothetical protein